MATLTTIADNWLGSSSNETIDALAGDDTLDGGAGNDSLLGGVGNDLIAGGAGTDTLKGGDGNDVLDGGTGSNFLYGDAGNDIIYGGSSADTLSGGIGNDFVSGNDGNDKLYGDAGSDALYGGDGNDVLSDSSNITTYGALSTEHDELAGGEGNDTFYGGYDTMDGEGGNDVFYVNNQGTVNGGVGNDVAKVTNTNVALSSWLDGGAGNDSLTGGSGNDILISGYGKDTLSGGLGNDTYVITFDDTYDEVTGLAGPGADTITDSGGTDTAYFIRDFAGDGRDDEVGSDGKTLDPTLKAGDFDVTLAANIENAILDDQKFVTNPSSVTYTVAWLTGNSLANNIKGSNLNDILDGAAGNDTISAGDGNDIIFVGNGSDVINGGAGLDIVASTVSFNLAATTSTAVENLDLLDYASAVSATGNSVANLLLGNKYNNTLSGAEGNDTLDGWFYSPTYAPVVDATKTTGNDTLNGGTGNDLYRIDATTDIVNEASTTGGIDTVEFKGAVATETYVLRDGVENLTMLGNLKNGVGNNLNNRIIGDSGINILKGGYGDDYLDGSGGIDNFEGGYGDDTYAVDSIAEVIKEVAGQGLDWVQSATIGLDLNTPSWGGSIENARLTGTSALNLTGSSANNRMLGNTAINVLEGRGGIDTLEGGLGNDIYYVDTTTDALIEVSNESDASGQLKAGFVDTIQSSVNFSIASLVNFENISLAPGSSATTATGNANNNVIKGNDIANTLYGLDGLDTLDGGAGVDTLVGGKGDDTYRLSNDGDKITEELNAGTDTIEISNTYSLSSTSNVENLTLLGTTAINGTGTAGANTIIGNAATNLLSGLAGSDSLKGGEGNDTLVGGSGTDTLDLTESIAKSDVVRTGTGESLATASEADKVIKFALANDTLDLSGTVVASTASAVNGADYGVIKSHTISNGIIKFDDTDAFTAALAINSSNLNDTINYVKANITTKDSTVAFVAGSDTWLFQDNGTSGDTLLQLVGVSTASSISTGAFSGTAIHIA